MCTTLFTTRTKHPNRFSTVIQESERRKRPRNGKGRRKLKAAERAARPAQLLYSLLLFLPLTHQKFRSLYGTVLYSIKSIVSPSIDLFANGTALWISLSIRLLNNDTRYHCRASAAFKPDIGSGAGLKRPIKKAALEINDSRAE